MFLANVYRGLGEGQCLHFQGRPGQVSENEDTTVCRNVGRNSVTFYKISVFSNTAVRTSDLAKRRKVRLTL